MLKRLIQIPFTRISCLRCTLSHLANPVGNPLENSPKLGDETLPIELEQPNTDKSVLGLLSEDISHISTYLKPTFNFAAYANKSETIQELVKLGVDLHYIEKKVTKAVPFILRLKFEHIKEHILFINDLGVAFKDIGTIITKNPFIFKVQLEDLKVRIHYLKYKKFTDEMVVRIITKNPFWLSYSTQEMDKKLGFFQINFKLLGNEVRQLAASKPQLVTFDQEKIKLNIFVIQEEMGLSLEDMKTIILKKPSLFMSGQHRLLKTFEYLHNVMKISHEQILENPQILTCREKRLKERHTFLVKLQRNQFDPRKPNYINLITMVQGEDGLFATEVAKSSAEAYNMFLKTI